MTVDCPHCKEPIEFGVNRPKFCAFCGKPLDDPGLLTTSPNSREMPTIAHTPTSRDGNGVPSVSAPEQIAGYRLIRPLGQGGMGTVYEAEEADFGRKVAIKLLSAEITASPEALERFRQEGRLASTISHPRCVFVLNADEEEGRPFIVMELMSGANLHDLVQSEGPLSVDRAVPKILDVIEGLREAHRLGVIHRDVKPSNCFLEGDGRVKVGDFGLSKSLVNESNLTRTGSFLGTPLYASPEQIKGEPLDPRTDVYSVAATLFYALTGRAPFQGQDAAATLAKIVSEPPPPLRSLRPELSAELERIILKGLERNRERRWRDLGEFATALIPFSPGRLRMGGLGLRIAAFVIDVNLSKLAIILFLSTGRLVATRGRIVAILSDNFALSVGLDLAIFLISFFLIEPIWGASPGKWLLGLRVRGQGTTASSPMTILRRNLIFWAIASLPWNVLTIVLWWNVEGISQNWIILPVRLACALIIGSTMRASNGYSGLHDLLTRTRVVAMPRIHKRRAGGARRALGRDRTVAARPVGVLKAIGPYKVRGAVRWEQGRKVLAAEDSSLGREVWIVLRPKSSPSPEPARRELSRATRPRWLSGGEHAEGRWDAFIAPSGCPLSDLAGPEGLPWRDARPILEDLAEELDSALRDGTLPATLGLDQVWIQPDGRALIVDQLGLATETTTQSNEHFPPNDRARRFLRSVAALALEGGRRRIQDSGGPIRAAVPWHARLILDRLDDAPGAYEDFAALRADLVSSQDKSVEVNHSLRATQLGALTAVLSMPLAAVFGLVFVQLNGDLPGYFARNQSVAPAANSYEFARVFALSFIGLVAAMWVIWAFATRGGMCLSLLELGISRRDGKQASRIRCGWRTFVIWAIPMSLLAGAVAMQRSPPTAGWPSWTLFGVAAVLVSSFPLLAMIQPSRGPHDRLSGTVLVPK
ncbi:MAG: prkC 16 [Planctomycetota bacterium]|nr:prkC 16 [Planctomycetota bacterium]